MCGALTSRPHATKNHNNCVVNYATKVEVEWLAILLRIREVSGSSLGLDTD